MKILPFLSILIFTFLPVYSQISKPDSTKSFKSLSEIPFGKLAKQYPNPIIIIDGDTASTKRLSNINPLEIALIDITEKKEINNCIIEINSNMRLFEKIDKLLRTISKKYASKTDSKKADELVFDFNGKIIKEYTTKNVLLLYELKSLGSKYQHIVIKVFNHRQTKRKYGVENKICTKIILN